MNDIHDLIQYHVLLDIVEARTPWSKCTGTRVPMLAYYSTAIVDQLRSKFHTIASKLIVMNKNTFNDGADHPRYDRRRTCQHN